MSAGRLEGFHAHSTSLFGCKFHCHTSYFLDDLADARYQTDIKRRIIIACAIDSATAWSGATHWNTHPPIYILRKPSRSNIKQTTSACPSTKIYCNSQKSIHRDNPRHHDGPSLPRPPEPRFRRFGGDDARPGHTLPQRTARVVGEVERA